MEINELINDIAGGRPASRENLDGNIDEEPLIPVKQKSGKKRIILPALSALILSVIAIAGYYFFSIKKGPNYINGPGGEVVLPAKGLHYPRPNLNSPVNLGVTYKTNQAEYAAQLKTQVKDQPVGEDKHAFTAPMATPAKLSNKNNLNDLFTVKYPNNNGMNPLNPVNSNMSPLMPAKVPFMPNFKMPNLKNMANGLKNIDGLRTVTLTISGFFGGIIAVKCKSGVVYLKTGSDICGWTLLAADTNHAVFSKNGEIKKINY